MLFLHRKIDDPTKFRPVNSQGAFVIDGNDLVPADGDDKFAAEIASLSDAGLLQAVGAAK